MSEVNKEILSLEESHEVRTYQDTELVMVTRREFLFDVIVLAGIRMVAGR